MNEETLFAQALALRTDSERQAFLDEHCGDRPQLRSELEELLAASDRAGEFLNHPPAQVQNNTTGGAEQDTADEDAPPFSLPTLEPCDQPHRIGKLGSYEIIEVVGQGGMGTVLRAWDTKLHRVVAIKVMASQLASNAAARKRFTREARAAAAVSHDHIVTIHAVDEAGGLPYLVMHYVSGVSLQQRLDRDGPLEPAEVVRIGMQTARGLAAAHAQGLIHRDIKPANILLENGVERVKITDFGLARAADDVGVTRTGEVTGTPHYMSPEQAQGKAVDTRSDLFSLGSVMYAMCTGRSPFRSETAVAALRRVCDDTPRPIREINSDVPGWLVAIIDRLLEKAPDDRFQTAGEVAEVLGRHLAHVPNAESTSRPAAVNCTRRWRGPWCRRFIVASALLLVVAVVLAEVTGVTNFSGNVTLVSSDDVNPAVESGDPAAERVPTTQPTSSIEQQIAELSEQIEHSREEGKARISRAHLYVRQGRWQDAADDLASAEDAVYDNPGNAFLYAILLVHLRKFDLHQRHCAKMLEHFDDTEDVWTANCLVKATLLRPGVVDLDRLPTKLLSEDRELVIDEPAWVLREARALIAYRRGDFDAARRLVRETMELPAYKNDPLYAPRALAILAMAAHQSGETSLASNLYEQAVKRLEPIRLTSDDIRASSWLYAEILRREAAQLLEREQTDTAPTGEPEAFVLGADGVEHRFATLAEAVESARDGGTIEVRGNGPFVSGPIRISHPLTIRAGSGFWPVINFSAHDPTDGYITQINANAPLVLEGLELRQLDSNATATCIVLAASKDLYVSNCRILTWQTSLTYLIAARNAGLIELRNSEFLGPAAIFPRPGRQLAMDNCCLLNCSLITGAQQPSEGRLFRVTHNTFQGWHVFRIDTDALRKAGSVQADDTVKFLRMEAVDNVFDVNDVLLLRREADLAPGETEVSAARNVDWHGQRNAYASEGFVTLSLSTSSGDQERPAELPPGLAGWTQLWGTAEEGSLEGTVRVQGGDLFAKAKAALETITPEDFRLRPESAGYQAGPEGKDLGADVDLVGPGEAYERWKKTPEYQQWLKESGQIEGVDAEPPAPLKLLRRFAENDAPWVTAIAYAPDGESVVTSSPAGLDVWRLESGEHVRRIEASGAEMTAFEFVDDGACLVGVTREGRLLGREWPSGEVRFDVEAHAPPGMHCVLLSDARIATTGRDGFVRVWEARSGRKLHEFRDLEADGQYSYFCLAVSPDEHYLAAGGTRRVDVWDLREGRLDRRLFHQGYNVHTVPFSPDGRHLLAGGSTGKIDMFEFDTGRIVHRFEKQTSTILSLLFLPDGRHFISGSLDGTLRVCALDGREIARHVSTLNDVSALALAPDGRHVVSAGRKPVAYNNKEQSTSATLQLWELPRSVWLETGDSASQVLGTTPSDVVEQATPPPEEVQQSTKND